MREDDQKLGDYSKARLCFYNLIQILSILGLPDVFNDNSFSPLRGKFASRYMDIDGTLKGKNEQ